MSSPAAVVSELDWDRLIDNPFHIGPFHRSMKAGDWWVITGMVVRLPEAMVERPPGTSKLLVFGDTIRCGGAEPSSIRFDGLSDVLLIGLNVIDTNRNTVFRRGPLIGDETFRVAFFSRTSVRGQNVLFRMDGGLRGDRYLMSTDHRWGELSLKHPALFEFYDAGPNAPRFGVEQFSIRELPLPASGAAFDAVGRTLLARLLLTAQSLFDADRPDDARRVLERFDALLSLVPDVPSWQALAAQCEATREMFQPPLPGPDRVPALSAGVYDSVARSYTQALAAFAGQFDRFTSRTLELAHRKDAARIMLQQRGNAMRFQAAVTEQLEGNLAAATANLERARLAMERQGERVTQAERYFNDAMEARREEERVKANRAIAGAVFSAVTGIAMTLAGKPADVAGIAQRISTSVEEAAKIALTLQRLARLIQAVARMIKMINEIMPAVSRRVSAAALATRMAAVRREAQSQLDGAPSESAYWDQFRLEIDDALDAAIKADIDGASDYLKQLRIFIIYGRALTAAQSAISPIAQELAQSHLLGKLAEEEQAAVQAQLDALEAHTTPPALTAALWLRHRAVRRALFAALQDFDAAHRYWALSTERLEFVPNRPIASLADDLLDIVSLDKSVQDALKTFDPPPQDFEHLRLQVPQDAIADFLRHGEFTLRFTRDANPLSHWGKVGRVRVKEIKVWVIWKKGVPPPDTMEFTVRTDGRYFDQRMQSGERLEFHFVGPQVNHSFIYYPAKTGSHRDGTISVAARVAEDFRRQFSEPTLFTAWRISLPRENGDSIDPAAIAALAGFVEGIELEFSGSYIKYADRVA